MINLQDVPEISATAHVVCNCCNKAERLVRPPGDDVSSQLKASLDSWYYILGWRKVTTKKSVSNMICPKCVYKIKNLGEITVSATEHETEMLKIATLKQNFIEFNLEEMASRLFFNQLLLKQGECDAPH